MALNKVLRRAKIKRRIRKKVFGTTAIPRLTVFRSNKQIYAQLVDDISGKTLASAGSLKMEDAQKTNKVNQISNGKIGFASPMAASFTTPTISYRSEIAPEIKKIESKK